MAANGRQQDRLMSNRFADHDPVWSPDGRLIAWTRFETSPNLGPSDIYVMDADGRHKRRLTTNRNAGQPTWSPDGKRIAYTGSRGIAVVSVSDPSRTTYISPEESGDFGSRVVT
jgi:Tol biopolymer transport system component